MKAKIVKVLKWMFFILIIISASIFLYFQYESYLSDIEDKERLKAFTDETWQYLDGSYKIIQYSVDENNLATYREVGDDYVFYIKKIIETGKKAWDYKLSIRVDFIENCTPNTKIETSVKLTEEYATLTCNNKGTLLTTKMMYSTPPIKLDKEYPVIKFDFDGYKVDVDLNDFYWDFSFMNKQLTLSKAKPI